jgi:hypothetical protein
VRKRGGNEAWEDREDPGVAVGDSDSMTAQAHPSACKSCWASPLRIGTGQAGVERMPHWDRDRERSLRWDWDWGSSSILPPTDREEDTLDTGDTPMAVDPHHTSRGDGTWFATILERCRWRVRLDRVSWVGVGVGSGASCF